MSLREIIGGDKIITKNRLQVELHNFWLKLLPYIKTINFNKKMAEAYDVSLFSHQMNSVDEIVIQGTNQEIADIVNGWLADENGIISFCIEASTVFTNAYGLSQMGRTWSVMELSAQERDTLKRTVNRTNMSTDILTQVFVKNNNNAQSGFNYNGLRYVYVEMSNDSINNAYIRVAIDNPNIPETAVLDFHVFGRRYR